MMIVNLNKKINFNVKYIFFSQSMNRIFCHDLDEKYASMSISNKIEIE